MDSISASQQRLSSSELLLWLLLGTGLILLCTLPGLGELMLTREEPRRVLIAQTMIDSGNYQVPELLGATYTAKPPLYNQLIALSTLLIHPQTEQVSEWSARLPSVASAILMFCLVLTACRQFLGRPALLCLAMGLILSPEIFFKGILSEIDLLFSALVSGSLWWWYALQRHGPARWRTWLFPMLLMSLAFLSKREPAVLFFYTGVISMLAWQGRLGLLLRAPHLLGLLLSGGLIALVYWPIIAHLGWQGFVDQTLFEANDLGGRFELSNLLIQCLRYPLEILLGLFPFSLALVLMFNTALRRRVFSSAHPHVVFAGWTVLLSLPVYLWPEQPKVRYFLPLFPSLLVIAATLIEQRLQASDRSDRDLRILLTLLGLLSLGALLFLLVHQIRPKFELPYPQVLSCALLVLLLTGVLWTLGKVFAAREEMGRLLFSTAGLFGLTFIVFWHLHGQPRRLEIQNTQRDPEQVTAFINHHVAPDDQPVLMLGEIPFDLFVYLEPGLIRAPTQPGPASPFMLGYPDKLAEDRIDLSSWVDTRQTVLYKRQPMHLYRRQAGATE